MKILRRQKVEEITGLSRSTIYALIQSGRFPRPIKLSARAVGWSEDAIHAWLKARADASGQ